MKYYCFSVYKILIVFDFARMFFLQSLLNIAAILILQTCVLGYFGGMKLKTMTKYIFQA